jgi:hypothetical protein
VCKAEKVQAIFANFPLPPCLGIDATMALI